MLVKHYVDYSVYHKNTDVYVVFYLEEFKLILIKSMHVSCIKRVFEWGYEGKTDTYNLPNLIELASRLNSKFSSHILKFTILNFFLVLTQLFSLFVTLHSLRTVRLISDFLERFLFFEIKIKKLRLIIRSLGNRLEAKWIHF
jgi:hypothetical protein